MEQDLHDDDRDVIADGAADVGATAISDPAAVAVDELEKPAAHHPQPPPDVLNSAPVEDVSLAALEVVDPYTAAPPAIGFVEPEPEPFAHYETHPAWQDPVPFEDPFKPIPYTPPSAGENIRRSGLAWSAGIVFFGSVAFTLFLGWIADLLLGISPWGIVGGVVLGSIIGFLQFFRISSRIFQRTDDGPEVRPLMSNNDDE